MATTCDLKQQKSIRRSHENMFHLCDQQRSCPEVRVPRTGRETNILKGSGHCHRSRSSQKPKTAKAQVYSKPEEVRKIQTKKQYHHHQKSSPSSKQPSSTQTQCYCCGKKGHAMKDCRLSNPVCKFCGRKGHIEAACMTKQKSSKVSLVTIPTINKLDDTTTSSPFVQVTINNRKFTSWWIQAHPVTSCPNLHGRLEHRDSRRMRPAL